MSILLDMNEIKVDKNSEHLIGVMGPRHQGNYNLIMPAVIRAVDNVAYDAGEDIKHSFVFIHDGVSSGSTGEMLEAVNKTQTSLRQYGYNVTVRKKLLDLEFHGKNAHYRWIDGVMDLEPDILLLFDNGEFDPVRYAASQAEQRDIPFMLVKINPEKEQ